jgi:hypothetical protein
MELCLALLKPTVKVRDVTLSICLEVTAFTVEDSSYIMKILNSNWNTTAIQLNGLAKWY